MTTTEQIIIILIALLINIIPVPIILMLWSDVLAQSDCAPGALMCQFLVDMAREWNQEKEKTRADK